MSREDELFGIDKETCVRLIDELVKAIGGKPKKTATREMIDKLSVDSRDQREIVVLAVMLGVAANG